MAKAQVANLITKAKAGARKDALDEALGDLNRSTRLPEARYGVVTTRRPV